MAGYRDNDYNVGLVMRQSIRERERKKETEIDRLTATGKKRPTYKDRWSER